MTELYSSFCKGLTKVIEKLPSFEDEHESMKMTQIIQLIDFDEIRTVNEEFLQNRFLGEILLHLAQIPMMRFGNLILKPASTIIQLPRLRIIGRDELRSLHNNGSQDRWREITSKRREFRQIFSWGNLEKFQDMGIVQIVPTVDRQKKTWSHVYLTLKGWITALSLDFEPHHNCNHMSLTYDILLDIHHEKMGVGYVLGRDEELILVSKILARRVRVDHKGLYPICGRVGAGLPSFLRLLEEYLNFRKVGRYDLSGFWINLDLEDIIENPVDALLTYVGNVVDHTYTSVSELGLGLGKKGRFYINISGFVNEYIEKWTKEVVTLINEVLLPLAAMSNIMVIMQIEDYHEFTNFVDSYLPEETPFPSPVYYLNTIPKRELATIAFENMFRRILPPLTKLEQPSILKGIITETFHKVLEENMHTEFRGIRDQLIRNIHFLDDLCPLIGRTELAVTNIIDFAESSVSLSLLSIGFEREFHELGEHIPLDIRNPMNTGLDKNHQKQEWFDNLFKIKGENIHFRGYSQYRLYREWFTSDRFTLRENQLLKLIGKIEEFFSLAEETKFFGGFPDLFVDELESTHIEFLKLYQNNSRLISDDLVSDLFGILIITGKQVPEDILFLQEIEFSEFLEKFRRMVHLSESTETFKHNLLRHYALNLYKALRDRVQLRSKFKRVATILRYLPSQFIIERFEELLGKNWNLGTTDDIKIWSEEISDYLFEIHNQSFQMFETYSEKFLSFSKKIDISEDSHWTVLRFWHLITYGIFEMSKHYQPDISTISRLFLSKISVKESLLYKFINLSKLKGFSSIFEQWGLEEIELNQEFLQDSPKDWLFSTVLTYPPSGGTLSEYLTSLMYSDITELEFKQEDQQIIIHAEDTSKIAKLMRDVYALGWLLSTGDTIHSLYEIYSENIHDLALEAFRVFVQSPDPIMRKISDFVINTVYTLVKHEISSGQIDRRELLRVTIGQLGAETLPWRIHTLFQEEGGLTDLISGIGNWIEDVFTNDRVDQFILGFMLSNLLHHLNSREELEVEIFNQLNGERTRKPLLHNLSVIWLRILPHLTEELVNALHGIWSKIRVDFNTMVFLCTMNQSPRVMKASIEVLNKLGEPELASVINFNLEITTSMKDVSKVISDRSYPRGIAQRYLNIVLAVMFLQKNGVFLLQKSPKHIMDFWLDEIDRVVNPKYGTGVLSVPMVYTFLRNYLSAVVRDDEHSKTNGISLLYYGISNWLLEIPSQILRNREDKIYSSIPSFNYIDHLTTMRLEAQEIIMESYTEKNSERLVEFLTTVGIHVIEVFGPIVNTFYRKFPKNEIIKRAHKIIKMQEIKS